MYLHSVVTKYTLCIVTTASPVQFINLKYDKIQHSFIHYTVSESICWEQGVHYNPAYREPLYQTSGLAAFNFKSLVIPNIMFHTSLPTDDIEDSNCAVHDRIKTKRYGI
jgi:hypothetical protein